MPPSSLELILNDIEHHLDDFGMEAINNPRLLYDPTTGYVLPPKFNGTFSVSDLIGPDGAMKSLQGTKKRKPKPKPGGAPDIPRPANRYILFRCDVLNRARSLELSKKEHSLVTADMGERWNQLPENVKVRYAYLSDKHKILHNRRYPDYKFKPLSKAQKQALEAKDRAAVERQIRKVGGRAMIDDDGNPRAGFRVLAGSASASPSMSRTPLKRDTDLPRVKYPSHYTADSWGPNGPPPDWAPNDGRTPLNDQGDEVEDEDDDDDEVEAEGADDSVPLFSAQTSLYQPAPGPARHQEGTTQPHQGIVNQPNIPPTNFDFHVPPTNPWPTLAHGVNWSQATPSAQSPQDHLSPASTAVPSTVGQTPRADYASWKTPSPQDQEIMITLPSTTVNEGLGFVGTVLPGALGGLQLDGSPDGVAASTPRLFDGTMAPAMMHAPSNNGLAENTLNVPMSIGFADQAFNNFLANASNGGVDFGVSNTNAEMLLSEYISETFRLPGANSAAINQQVPPAPAIQDVNAFAQIQGMDPLTYGFYTGSTGAGALPSEQVPHFLESLGFQPDMYPFINIPQDEVTVGHEGLGSVADWNQPSEAVQRDQPVVAQEQEEDPNMSFGSMVSFSGGADEQEETQRPIDHAALFHTEHHPSEKIVSASPVERKFVPQEAVPSETGRPPAPPPYVPPAGATNFSGRRVGGNWRPPFAKQDKRTVSVQSSQSVLVHDVDEFEDDEPYG
ncbi:hypothetical protein FRB90_006504, partial [Tulasnella sp. 427]